MALRQWFHRIPFETIRRQRCACECRTTLPARIAVVLGLVGLAMSLTTEQATGQLPPAVPVGEPMPARIIFGGIPRIHGHDEVSFSASIDFLLPPHRLYNIDSGGVEFEIRGVVPYQRHLPNRCRMAAGELTGNFNIAARGYRVSAGSDEGKMDWMNLFLVELPQMGTEQDICTIDDNGRVFEARTTLSDPPLRFAEGWPDTVDVVDNFSIARQNPRYSITLQLACPLQPPAPDDAPQITVTPPIGAWPLRVDHTKTRAEILALAESGGLPVQGTVYGGLTTFPSFAVPVGTLGFQSRSADTAFGEGRCWWLPSFEMAFSEIEMYIDRRYPEGSCEYNAIRQHEERHYEAIVNSARVFQEFMRENAMGAILLLNTPTRRHPAYSTSATGMIPTREALRNYLSSIVSPMYDQMRAEGELLDQALGPIGAQCNDW